MSAGLFLAKRFIGRKKNSSLSGPVIRIAILAIGLGMTVMLVSVSIVTGFKQEIREKVIGFGSHIQITNYDLKYSMENRPVEVTDNMKVGLQAIKGVKHVQNYANKAGIIKTDNDIQGVLLKGIGTDFAWSFFEDRIVEGSRITLNDSARVNDILISRYLCRLLNLEVGSDVHAYFIQEPPRARKFQVKGIYDTGLSDFDKLYVFCDIGHVQRLNNWDSSMVSGVEIFIEDFSKLDAIADEIFYAIDSHLNASTIRELHPQIFGWLDLQDVNVQIIIILMLIVAIINIVSALLILILEKTTTIGVLKAVGAGNFLIQKVFIYKALYIAAKGMLWGNIAGIGLCLVQKTFKVITLPVESYYLEYVPINLDITYILLLNVGTLSISLLALLLPSLLISGIRPVKAIRFD